jgi:hypothetical protein
METTKYNIDLYLPDVEIHIEATSLKDAKIWWGDYVANIWEEVGTYAECLGHLSFLIFCAENNYEIGYGNIPFSEVFDEFVTNCQRSVHKSPQQKAPTQ